jgi:hypothetical protein
MTPASVLSLLSRSSTVSTVMPAFLVGGSLTAVTTLRGSRSMSREAASMDSMGFFLAWGEGGRGLSWVRADWWWKEEKELDRR